MQRGQEHKRGSKESENEMVMELKTELATVVEVLCVLHDFVDNLFGVKFQSFCESNSQLASQVGVLKDLRWKHLGDCLPRRSTSSSAGKSTELRSVREGGVSRLPLIIGSPEVVDVKCEMEGDEEVPDFLEDVDPFGGEGEASSKNYDAHHYLSGYEGMIDQDIPPYITGDNAGSSLSSTPHTSNRYSTEYIIVENDKDPLQEQEQEQADEDSSQSSEESDDWNPSMEDPTSAFFTSKNKSKEMNKLYKMQKHPSSASTSTPSSSSSSSKRTRNTNDKKLYSQQQVQVQIQLQRQSSTESSKGDGGRFKCDQCPASYSQEESLRSHQKYKHNPSRVQCTCHLCGKSMVDKYRLQRHLRLHTGEKPFSCQYCGQRFYRKDYHTKHLQRKHGLFNSTSSNSSASSKAGQKKTPVSKSTPEASSTSTTPSKSGGGGGSKSSASNSSFVAPSSSSSRASTSHHQSATSSTPSSTVVKQENSFLDYFINSESGSSNQASSSSVPTSSLVTMTSLTFDDLIREDL